MNANQITEATEYLNSQAANYGDEAIYEFLRVEEKVDEDYYVLTFRQIIEEKVQKIVRLDFIIKDGHAVAN